MEPELPKAEEEQSEIPSFLQREAKQAVEKEKLLFQTIVKSKAFLSGSVLVVLIVLIGALFHIITADVKGTALTTPNPSSVADLPAVESAETTQDNMTPFDPNAQTGSATVSATPSASPSPTTSASPTPTPTPTPSPTTSPTPTNTPAPTDTPSSTDTPAPTDTPTPTPSPTPSPTASASASPSPS